MAFYSVRIDDDGKEIETTRQTYRTLFNDPSKDNQNGVKGRQPSQTPASTFRTVRYVNSAIFIERDLEEEDESEVDDDSNLDDFDFSVDVTEPSDQNDLIEDKFIESVPVLEIKSNESFPSTDNLSYSYRRVCEATKLIQRPNAYGEWLEAKKMANLLENKRKKERKRQEENEKQQRKNLAEEKYKEWLQRKSKIKTISSSSINKDESQNNFSEADKTSVESNFKAWLEKKKEQQKVIREKCEEDLKREKLLSQRRQDESTAIYEDWRKLAPQKPKPVPLNKGIFTLKGSISQLYINPIPWISTDKTESTLSI